MKLQKNGTASIGSRCKLKSLFMFGVESLDNSVQKPEHAAILVYTYSTRINSVVGAMWGTAFVADETRTKNLDIQCVACADGDSDLRIGREVEAMVHLHLRSAKGLQSQLVYICSCRNMTSLVKDRSPSTSLRKMNQVGHFIIIFVREFTKDQRIMSSATYEYSQFSVSPQFFRMSL
jgi:hypothetical protein